VILYACHFLLLLFLLFADANGEFSGSVLEDMGWSKSVNKSNIGMPAPNPSHRQLADLTTFRFLTDQTPAATVASQQHMLGTEQGMQAAKEALAATALGNLILALIGLPGYVVAVLIIDKLGRRNLQLLGFGAVAFIYTILGVALAPLVDHAKPALLIFYGLSFFFLNVGPNTSTFVIPAEAFPTRAKATCHGISAASGKLGAVIGAAMMSPLLDWYGNATPEAAQKGLALVLYACAAVSVLGFVWTFFFTQETSKISIEHLDRYGVHSFRMAKTKSRLRNRKSGAGGDYDEVGGGLSTLDESVSTGTGSGSNSNVTTPRGSNADAGAIGLIADAAGASDPADAEPHKQQKRLGLAGSSAALDIRQAPILNALSNSSHSSRLVIGNTTTTGYTTSNDLGGSSYSEGLLGASPASNFDLAETPPKPIAPNLPHVPGMLVSDEERAKILGRPWSPGMELNTTKKS
jgi:MFS family permease